MVRRRLRLFFFNDTATTEIYTLSLHDALPISRSGVRQAKRWVDGTQPSASSVASRAQGARSEEHTSELQSRQYLVCRLLLEKKTNTAPVRRRSAAGAAASALLGGHGAASTVWRPSPSATLLSCVALLRSAARAQGA